MRFEILEHPADIGFRAFGATLGELFANAALALVSIASEPAAVQSRQEYALAAEGSDYESLLVAWLAEVLFWFDGKRVAFREFRVRHIEPTSVRGAGLGEPCDATRHEAKLIVKAVTWHQLRVYENAGGWVAEVYLDI